MRNLPDHPCGRGSHLRQGVIVTVGDVRSTEPLKRYSVIPAYTATTMNTMLASEVST